MQRALGHPQLILLLTPLVCALIPLIAPGSKNFEYEYTLVFNLVFIILLPPVVFFLKGNSRFKNRDLLWSCCLAPFIACIPGVIAFRLKLCPCSEPGFLFWFLLNSLPTIVLAHGCAALALHTTRLWTFLLLHCGLILGLSLELLLRIWLWPQKRALHLLFGFVHGPIYDHWIPVDYGIMLGRAAHLVLGIGLFTVLIVKGKSLRRIIAVTGFLGWVAFATAAGHYPSTQHGFDSLLRLLPDTITVDLLTFHFDRNGTDTTRMQRLADEGRFHLRELRPLLKIDEVPRVHVFVYPDEDRKKLWFGGGGTDITDVRTPSIHILAQGFPHPSLRHELVHALFSRIGFHGLGFHPNMAFTEGLAVALAPEARVLSLHSGSAFLMQHGKGVALEHLFSPAFWFEASQRSYTIAGSLIKYLIDEFGAESVKKLYAGESWEKVFGAHADGIMGSWRATIESEFNAANESLLGEALFRAPGTLGELCPHSKADLNREAGEDPYHVSMRQPWGWNRSRDFEDWRDGLDPTRLEYRVARLQRQAKKMLTQGGDQPTLQAIIAEYAKLVRTEATAVEDVEIGLALTDLTYLAHEPERSREILERLSALAAQRNLGALGRQVAARVMLHQLLPGQSVEEWRRYLAELGPMPALSAASPWFLHYLRLRRVAATLSEPELRALLEPTMNPPTDTPAAFAAEWYRILADACMQRGLFFEADRIWEAAASQAPTGTRHLYQLYARLARFLAH